MAQEQAAADANASAEAAKAAEDAAAAEAERMRKLLAGSAAEKAELEAKVARAAGALKAADDLREARQKHREEVTKLKQELSSLQSSSKGGMQAVDRTKKDLEKTRWVYLLLRPAN